MCVFNTGGSSPQGSYSQIMPSRSATSGLPPHLPPLLQQTILNQGPPSQVYTHVYTCIYMYMDIHIYLYMYIELHIVILPDVYTVHTHTHTYLYILTHSHISGGPYSAGGTKSRDSEPPLCPLNQGIYVTVSILSVYTMYVLHSVSVYTHVFHRTMS